MTYVKNLFLIPAAACLASPAALAQDASAPERQDTATFQDQSKTLRPDRPFVSHDELIGMDVWSGSKTGARGDEDADRSDLGDINDFVFDASTGEITHVVISSGGIGDLGDTLRAVECKQLQWSKDSEGEMMVSLPMDEASFERIQEFDPEKLGRDAVDASARRAKDAAKDWSDDERDARAGNARAAIQKVAQSHLLTNLAGLDVYAKDQIMDDDAEAFTEVAAAIIDQERGSIAFIRIEADDEEYIVPFEALEVRTEETDDDEEPEYSIVVPKGPQELKGSQAVDSSEDSMKNARSARFRAQVYEFYGLEEPNTEFSSKDKEMDSKKKEWSKRDGGRRDDGRRDG